MSRKDDEDCPVSRRECTLIQANMAERISALRKEIIIAVSVSTTWISLLVLILSYVHKI